MQQQLPPLSHGPLIFSSRVGGRYFCLYAISSAPDSNFAYVAYSIFLLLASKICVGEWKIKAKMQYLRRDKKDEESGNSRSISFKINLITCVQFLSRTSVCQSTPRVSQKSNFCWAYGLMVKRSYRTQEIFSTKKEVPIYCLLFSLKDGAHENQHFLFKNYLGLNLYII